MEIWYKLPEDISHKIFVHFRHPNARRIIHYWRSRQVRNLLEDIQDYPRSLKELYSLPFAKDHDGIWGRARLLNSLWTEARLICGNYYKIWERMYRVRCEKTAEWWIRWRYATHCHTFQINSLWALFTVRERGEYLQKYM